MAAEKSPAAYECNTFGGVFIESLRRDVDCTRLVRGALVLRIVSSDQLEGGDEGHVIVIVTVAVTLPPSYPRCLYARVRCIGVKGTKAAATAGPEEGGAANRDVLTAEGLLKQKQWVNEDKVRRGVVRHNLRIPTPPPSF